MRSASLFRSIGVLLSGSIIQSFIKVVILGVLARLLAPKDFGIVNAATVVIGFIQLFNELGVGAAIVQVSSINEKLILTAKKIALLSGVFFFIILFATSNLIASSFGISELSSILKFCAFIFVIESLAIIPKALLQREMKFGELVKIDLIAFIVGYSCVAGLLAYLGFSYWSLIGGVFGQSILRSAMLNYKKSLTLKRGIDKQSFFKLINFGSGFTLARFFNYSALNVDNFIVSRYQGAVNLGYYGRAYQLMVFPASLIGAAIDKVMFSALSRTFQSSKKMTQLMYENSLNISLFLSSFISVLVYHHAEAIVLVVLGSKWTSVVTPLKILALSLGFRLSYKINISLIRASGQVYHYAMTQLIYFLFVAVGCFLVKEGSLSKIAAVVTLSIVANYLITTILVIYLKHGSAIRIFRINAINLGIYTILFVLSFLIVKLLSVILRSDFWSQVTIMVANFIIMSPLVLLNRRVRRFCQKCLLK